MSTPVRVIFPVPRPCEMVNETNRLLCLPSALVIRPLD